MRKSTFPLALAVISMLCLQASLYAQGTRQYVALEIFSGTWCTYCPGSSLGADDMAANGHRVAIMEHHIGDSYETTETDARDTWYNVQGYPTSWFDGTEEMVGGNASQSIYTSYKGLYDITYPVSTPYNMTMSWTPNGNDIDVTVDIEQVGAHTPGNLVLHVVPVESHIPENWLGLTEVNFVTRDFVPDQNGTAISVTQGNSVQQTLTVVMNPSWVQSNMEVVAFLQDMTTKEVFNAFRLPLEPSPNTDDPKLVYIQNGLEGYTCTTSFTPEVMVENLGSDTITSLEITYSVNGGTPSVYNWTGSMPWAYYEVMTLPVVNFTPLATNNTFTAEITGVNSGATDADLNNNDDSFTWNYSNNVGTYTFTVTTDNYGYETYWEIVNSSMTVIASGGNQNVGANGGGQQSASGNDPGAYGNNSTVTETVLLANNDCYALRVLDDWGDGICCSYGNGSYTLTDPSGNVMLTGGSFGASEENDWFADGVIAVDNRMDEEVSVYPNPNNGLFTVEIGEGFASEATVSVHQLDGREVFRTVTSGQVLRIDVGDLASGIYMVKVNSENGLAVKKLTIE